MPILIIILIRASSAGGRLLALLTKLFNCFACSASTFTPSARKVATGSLTNLAFSSWPLFRRVCRPAKSFVAIGNLQGGGDAFNQTVKKGSGRFEKATERVARRGP